MKKAEEWMREVSTEVEHPLVHDDMVIKSLDLQGVLSFCQIDGSLL